MTCGRAGRRCGMRERALVASAASAPRPPALPDRTSPCPPAALLSCAQLIVPMYATPPKYGAAIATTILADPQLRQQWQVRLLSLLRAWPVHRYALRAAMCTPAPQTLAVPLPCAARAGRTAAQHFAPAAAAVRCSAGCGGAWQLGAHPSAGAPAGPRRGISRHVGTRATTKSTGAERAAHPASKSVSPVRSGSPRW